MSFPAIRLSTISVAAVVAAGVHLRLIGFPKPVWLDEAWVANSVLAETWAGMFRYEAWQQTTPPLVLLIARGIVDILGLSEASLRIFPLVCGCLMPLLAWLLARRILTPPFQFLFVAFASLNLLLIDQSQQLKQYSSDATVACALLWLLWRYAEDPSLTRYRVLLAGFVIAPALSYPAACYAPAGLLLVMLTPSPRAQKRSLVLGSVVAAVSLGLYLLFVLPNRSPDLVLFWQPYLPDLSSASAVSAFYREKFELLLQRLPFVYEFRLFFYGVYILAAVVAAIGFLRSWGSSRSRFLLTATCGPLAAVLALNLAHVYPFDGKRLSAFLLPAFFLLVAAGLEFLWQWIRDLFPAAEWRPRVDGLIFLGAIAFAAVFFVYARGQVSATAGGVEDMASVFRFLRERTADGDLIYLHPSVAEQSKLYSRIDQWNPPNAVVGLGAWPCCAMGHEFVHRTPGRELVIEDFRRQAGLSRSGHVWMVSTARPVHWESVGLDEPREVLRSLDGIGCSEVEEQRFTGIRVNLIDCAAGSRNVSGPPDG